MRRIITKIQDMWNRFNRGKTDIPPRPIDDIENDVPYADISFYVVKNRCEYCRCTRTFRGGYLELYRDTDLWKCFHPDMPSKNYLAPDSIALEKTAGCTTFEWRQCPLNKDRVYERLEVKKKWSYK
jgi:hypothetical protein